MRGRVAKTLFVTSQTLSLGHEGNERALTEVTCGGVSPSVNVCRLSSAIQGGRLLVSSGSRVSRTYNT